MASRKTYFGIGWQDPTDLDGGTPAKTDAEDRSAPTVVDEEKVAEELKRLRSWYQGDEQQGGSPINPPPAAPSALNPVGAQSRPTAVGHATGPPAATQPRPMAPDPMRATMYGHDVHQFDLDMPPTSQPPPAGNAPLISSADAKNKAAQLMSAPAR